MVGVAQVRQLVPQHVVADGRRMATSSASDKVTSCADSLMHIGSISGVSARLPRAS